MTDTLLDVEVELDEDNLEEAAGIVSRLLKGTEFTVATTRSSPQFEVKPRQRLKSVRPNSSAAHVKWLSITATNTTCLVHIGDKLTVAQGTLTVGKKAWGGLAWLFVVTGH